MIGIGWIENNKWNFKNLLVNRLSYYEERLIINKFLEILNSNKNCKVYHWSNAEPILLNKALIRNHIEAKINWVDLLKILENDITKKGFRKVEEWANKIGVKTIDVKIKKFDTFFNINTKKDFEEAKKIMSKN